MKTTILTLLVLFCSITSGQEAILKQTKERPHANFKISLSKLLANEGFYSNNRFDRGGETYQGVARKVSPDWKGWKYVDAYKQHNKLAWNDSIPDGMVNHYVLDYYLDIWVKEGFIDIKDQDVADYLFDLRVNANIGSLLINRTLRYDFKCTVSLTNQMSEAIIRHVNHVPAKKLLSALAHRRLTFYNDIVSFHPDQKVWLDHWLSRTVIHYNPLKRDI